MEATQFSKEWLVRMCLSIFGGMSPEEKKTLAELEEAQRLQERKLLEGIKALQK